MNINIELSEAEIRIIEQSLDCWEKSSSTEAILGCMIGAVLRKGDEPESTLEKLEEQMKEASTVNEQRRRQSVLLRAKIIQAMNRQSEHAV